MPKKISTALVILGIIIIGCLWIVTGKYFQQTPYPKNIGSKNDLIKSVSLIIDNGQNRPIAYKLNFNKESTAFDLLKEVAKENGLTIKAETYDIGILIVAIGNEENGKNGKYWLYYINGQMPMVSVDKQKINPGDKVEFKFEKSPF